MNKHESELIDGRKVILSNTFFPDIFWRRSALSGTSAQLLFEATFARVLDSDLDLHKSTYTAVSFINGCR